MDITKELKQNQESQATIRKRLFDMDNTRSVFTQELLRLEGEARILAKLQKEETDGNTKEVPRQQDS